MTTKGILLLLAVMASSFFIGSAASALSLKVAPLEYRTTLEKDEQKRGVIDISNPTGSNVTVQTSVEGFRQINDDGGLQFYRDALLRKAITLDLKEFELGPRESIRMPFVVKGETLPEGNVYGAILFTINPQKPVNGVGQSVRIGTLLSIVNGTPSQTEAAISAIAASPIQLSEQVKGSYSVQNTGSSKTGFYPVVNLSSWPSGNTDKATSTLVFGGRTRTNDFELDTGFGIHRVSAAYEGSSKSQWVIAAPPWFFIVLIGLLAVGTVELLLLRRRRLKHARRHRSTS